MTKQTYYIVINRGTGKGDGTRIKLKPNRHPYILSYLEYYQEELEEIHAKDGNLDPVKTVNDFEWGHMIRELGTEPKIKTLKVVAFGSKEYLSIAHASMADDIQKTLVLSENAKDHRIEKAKEIVMETVIRERAKNIVRETLQRELKYSQKKLKTATLADVILLTRKQLLSTKGCGKISINEIENILTSAELKLKE